MTGDADNTTTKEIAASLPQMFFFSLTRGSSYYIHKILILVFSVLARHSWETLRDSGVQQPLVLL